MKIFLKNTNFHPDVEFIDGYITNQNGSQSNLKKKQNLTSKFIFVFHLVRLENPCSLYENLDICQNNGVCVVMPNGLPACS